MKKIALKLLLLALAVAAIFYLFVLPPMVATGFVEQSPMGIAFAAFMLLQFWMLGAEFAYESASAVFGFERKRLFIFLNLHRHENKIAKSKTGFSVLFLAFLSYLFMVYGFGVIYIFISNANPSSFNIGSLSLVEGMYFSLVTSATVGFGDITPSNDLARIVIMCQIILSMAYVVMLFSSAVSFVRESGNKSPNK